MQMQGAFVDSAQPLASAFPSRSWLLWFNTLLDPQATPVQTRQTRTPVPHSEAPILQSLVMKLIGSYRHRLNLAKKLDPWCQSKAAESCTLMVLDSHVHELSLTCGFFLFRLGMRLLASLLSLPCLSALPLLFHLERLLQPLLFFLERLFLFLTLLLAPLALSSHRRALCCTLLHT
eukprot:m.86907 g.86907  ORF g.86907 m.86907 type:complete len:176 (-) comp8444_c1_seq1:1564-2091(-)